MGESQAPSRVTRGVCVGERDGDKEVAAVICCFLPRSRRLLVANPVPSPGRWVCPARSILAGPLPLSPLLPACVFGINMHPLNLFIFLLRWKLGQRPGLDVLAVWLGSGQVHGNCNHM